MTMWKMSLSKLLLIKQSLLNNMCMHICLTTEVRSQSVIIDVKSSTGAYTHISYGIKIVVTLDIAIGTVIAIGAVTAIGTLIANGWNCNSN